jgi:peptide chain release factor 2
VPPWKPNASTPSAPGSPTSTRDPPSCGGIFDFDAKRDRLVEVSRILEDPGIWSDTKRAQELGKEKKALEETVGRLSEIDARLRDASDLFELAREENDDATLVALEGDVAEADKRVDQLEFERMFADPLDPNNCFVDLQAGSGGTEAQDWAAMLQRMYTRYGERKGFKVELLEQSDGDVAGIKSATLKVSGDYAFGTLRTETGVHRLVRKSPFDSNARRHTSFASVFVYPGGRRLDRGRRSIRPTLRIDTFRASGRRRPAHQQDRLGGAHHAPAHQHRRAVPERPLAAPQQGRSDGHAEGRLYELELRKRNEAKQALEDSKTDIGWGHQIRSYVLDQSRIKDSAHQRRDRQHPGRARRRPGRLHQREPEARGLT